MTTEHPITPPPELVMQWVSLACEYEGNETWIDLATQAARWGVDQGVEACCEWLEKGPYGFTITASAPHMISDLRAAMRPKPPSLAEEGQRILVENGTTLDGRVELDPEDVSTIRRALERLQELMNWSRSLDQYYQRQQTRAELLAIVTELESQ